MLYWSVGAVVLSVNVRASVENTSLTFPIKKRIKTELFIDRTATLYKGQAQIREKTNEDEGDHHVGTCNRMKDQVK